jgi:uncharacterized phosphosugar-binding protein
MFFMPDHFNQQPIGLGLFWHEALKILERVRQTQADAIRRASHLFADSIGRDGVIQAYGTGHSRAFTMELAGRAGGLVPVNRIDLEDLALYTNWPLERVRRPDIERDIEAGHAILECYHIFPQDVFIIASQSGVNAAIVEVAQQAKARGHSLVAVTSLDHTQHVESRHPSGKKLYELADIIIDNCGPYGDALLDLPIGGKACAVSSLSTMLIAQMLTAETVHTLIERGVEPLVFLSANTPGGIEQGERIRRRYEGRIQRTH